MNIADTGDSMRTIKTLLAATALVAAGMSLHANVRPVHAGGFVPVNVTGTIFEDFNGDGVQQLEEQPLEGWIVHLADGDDVVQTTFTQAFGDYTFSAVGAGTFTVFEEPPASWALTTSPDYYSVTTSSGVDVGGLVFGNFLLGILSGNVLKDLTGNGFSPDDTPFATPVKIQLFLNGGAVPVTTTTTYSGGWFSFSGLGPGLYTVRELVPAGYVLTAQVEAATYGLSGFVSAGNDFDNSRPVALAMPAR